MGPCQVALVGVMILRASLRTSITLVHLLVTSKVGNNGEVSTAAFDLACKWLLASVAVHVRLEGRRPCESLVADLALVFLLSA